MTARQHDFSADKAERAGNALLVIDAHLQGWRSVERIYAGMSIRAPRVQGDEYLVTVRSQNADGVPEVAFHNGIDLMDVLVGLANRLENGSLKWREDTWQR